MRGAATFRNARDLDVILDEEEEADQDNDYVTHYQSRQNTLRRSSSHHLVPSSQQNSRNNTIRNSSQSTLFQNYNGDKETAANGFFNKNKKIINDFVDDDINPINLNPVDTQ